MCKKIGMCSVVKFQDLATKKTNVLYNLEQKQRVAFPLKKKKKRLVFLSNNIYEQKINYVNSLDTKHYNYMLLDLPVNHHQSFV